jgi:cytochrome b6-f complex iron-sulfur subunit
MADQDKKKMSVADILAAARKSDASNAADAAPAPGDTASDAAPAATDPSAAAKPAATKPAAAKPASAKAAAKPAGGARPSIADMMAAARAEKAPGAASGPKPAAAKSAAVEKQAPAAKPAAAKAAPKAAPAVAGPKDTGSILADARSAIKPGPMSKAEAALKSPAVKSSAAKPKAVVPPMPPKPDYAKPKAKAPVDESRRNFLTDVILGSFLGVGFVSLGVTLGLWTLGTARFMFPNVLTEPPSKFKVGFPSNFAPGQVETKFIPQFGVWVVNYEYNGKSEIYALRSVCTHLGCTPNWLEGEQKFKCPCHGSGFYKDGINFEGPAPRPLERYAIHLADDGQLEIDKSKTFQEEIGQWSDPASFVVV